MSNKTNYLPVTKPNGNLLNKETGELLPVTYFPGRPLQYRFDASRGLFNIRGEVVLTKPREAFELIPVAYRVFTDDILGVGRKRWAEFFFLNEERMLCNLLLHGYSVQNLMQVVADRMFYDNVKLTQVRLKVTPVQKESKSPGAEGKKYHIAQFDYEQISAEEAATLQNAVKGLHIWREETNTGAGEIQFAENYSPPVFEEVPEGAAFQALGGEE
ncbi:MAG: hypothetical protein H6566_18315 [Lewinellaceae bacterium]|nr:hypothetical protein [Lewinellaceae bacterium]